MSLFLRSELPSCDEPRSEACDEFFDPLWKTNQKCPIYLLGIARAGARIQTSCGYDLVKDKSGFPLSCKFYVRLDVLWAGFTYVNKIRSGV